MLALYYWLAGWFRRPAPTPAPRPTTGGSLRVDPPAPAVRIAGIPVAPGFRFLPGDGKWLHNMEGLVCFETVESLTGEDDLTAEGI